MIIFTKNSDTTFKHQVDRKVAKPVARREMADRVKEEKDKTGAEYKGRINQGDAMKNYRDYKRSMDNTMPETLDGITKSKMWKRAKELKDMFKVGMLSRDELHPVKQFEVNGTIKTVVDESRMANLNSVNRNVAWNKKNEKYVKEFKNIMRHLDPDNPHAGDVERFRPIRKGRA